MSVQDFSISKFTPSVLFAYKLPPIARRHPRFAHLIARSPASFCQLQQNVTFDPKWPPTMAANCKQPWPCCLRYRITPNSPKSRSIVSVTTKWDIWPKMAAKDGFQLENFLDHVARDVELPLIVRSPARFSQLRQNVTFDPRWLTKMAAKQKTGFTMLLATSNYP